jgi:hypothetical protein
MLGLKLREEFRGKLMKGTAIELANDSKTGATQLGAQAFLGITYPTHDLVKAIEAIAPGQARPVVVIGERGAGAAATDSLPHDLVVELLQEQPVMLLLDGCRAWFDGLANSDQQPTRARAFTFIQILSEVAKQRPDLLVLAISVRNGRSSAYPQELLLQAGGKPAGLNHGRIT